VEFPWHKLDGRPLIYASMGTLQNRQGSIFETIAAACAEFDAQLVLSLGSRHREHRAEFAGAPLVVPFAPQIELLKRATLSITHAGLNTALESLTQGLPMVAIPITNDQPGVASRLEWLGVAEVVPPALLSAARLRASVGRLLNEPHYRVKSQQWKAEIGRSDGLAQAANIVDQAIAKRRLIGGVRRRGWRCEQASGVQTARGAIGVLGHHRFDFPCSFVNCLLGHGSIFQLVVHRSQLLTMIPYCLTFCTLRPVAA
jgi:hypothetical protein